MTELDQMIANIREAARKDSFDLDELEFYSKGGTSTIFRGTHKKEPVAIKVLDKPDDKKWLNRLRQESNVLKKLNHDRVVKRVGPGLLELDRNVVLLTEFVGGETLRKLTEGKRLDDRDALFLLSEIADALHHVHDRGVVHRDLHDANIILRAGSLNDPVVIDFGVARDASLDELRNNEEYYRTFRPIGAMSHCAPEKWMSPHDARPKSDLFSLGVMIYRNVTGKPPFWGD